MTTCAVKYTNFQVLIYEDDCGVFPVIDNKCEIIKYKNNYHISLVAGATGNPTLGTNTDFTDAMTSGEAIAYIADNCARKSTTTDAPCGGKKIKTADNVETLFEPEKYTTKAVEPPIRDDINSDFDPNGGDAFTPEGDEIVFTAEQLEAIGKRKCDNYVELRLDASVDLDDCDDGTGGAAGWLINGDNEHKFRAHSDSGKDKTVQMIGFYPLASDGSLHLQRTRSNTCSGHMGWSWSIRAFQYRDFS